MRSDLLFVFESFVYTAGLFSSYFLFLFSERTRKLQKNGGHFCHVKKENRLVSIVAQEKAKDSMVAWPFVLFYVSFNNRPNIIKLKKKKKEIIEMGALKFKL